MSSDQPSTNDAKGLSPQVRGNRPPGLSPRGLLRTIPAGAGEPAGLATEGYSAQDYPRRCGGTASRSRSRNRLTGLSPQVRGNHPDPNGRRRCPGTIPAGAGEPSPCGLRGAASGDYPRRCGGTSSSVRLGA